MPRRELPPVLDPRQARTVLGWSMQKARVVHGWGLRQTAKEFGGSASRLSRVERGQVRPSRALVLFYEEAFAMDGLLLSQFEVVVHAGEQDRRREGGHRGDPDHPRQAIPGDASSFVDDTIPHGTLMKPGELFVKTWRIRNSGTVFWKDRRLERQGPITGPGLITSAPYYVVPDTAADEIAEIAAPLKAPTYDCASIAYFKMVDRDGRLSFPANYQLGLDVLVLVRGQLPDKPST